ncbi:hypothetical protein Tco_0691254 [Tanacetum coccineum]
MSSVGKFVHDSNKAPDSPPHPHTFSSNQRHCFHCKDVLGDGEFCQRCTCMRCGSGLSKGLCLICASRYGNNPNPNSLNDSPNISENVSQSPPLIDHHCCYGCGDSLDGIFCQRCTCESCGNGAHYGYNCPPKVPTISNPEPCHNQNVDEFPQTLPSFHPTCYSGDGSSFTYDSTPNFVDDSRNIFNPTSQPPMYSCEFCGNDAHYGYDCPPQYSVIHQPPHEKTIGELLAEERAANIDQSPPQEMSIQEMEDLKQHYLDEMKNKQNFNGMSIEIRKKEKELLQQEQAAYVRTSQRFNFIYYDDDDDEESSIPLSDVISELPPCVAITPVVSTEEPDNFLSMGDEHLDTILATESDELIKSSVEDLVPIPNQFEEFSDSNDDSTSIDDDSFSIDDIDYVDASPPESELISLEVVETENGEIDTDILLTIKDDILCEKLLNVNRLIAKIEALKDNPTPSFDFVTKSTSTSPNSFLEETNISYNSLPESETFCFNLEEKSSGNPTSYTELSLSDYEAFFCDSEPDSGDFIMDSFVIKFPILVEDGDSFLEKFETTPELETFKFDIEEKNSGRTTIHADISLPDLECVYFKSEPDLGDLTSIDPGIRENISSTTNVNLPFEDDQSPLFAYVVWIFLSFLTYPIAPPYLLSSGNEDTIFDLDISIYHSFMPGNGLFIKDTKSGQKRTTPSTDGRSPKSKGFTYRALVPKKMEAKIEGLTSPHTGNTPQVLESSLLGYKREDQLGSKDLYLFLDNISGMIKAIEGVRKIIAGPATWMLEFSSQVVEARLCVDFGWVGNLRWVLVGEHTYSIYYCSIIIRVKHSGQIKPRLELVGNKLFKSSAMGEACGATYTELQNSLLGACDASCVDVMQLVSMLMYIAADVDESCADADVS